MENLEGKVAVVTGGASGIGLAMARAFLGAGMDVAVGDIEAGVLEAAVGELEAVAGEGRRVLGVPCDVSERASVDELRDRTFAELGGAHLVCNNAGVATGGPLWLTTEADWEWIVGVNLMGVVHGIQAFVPGFLEQGEGHVVNTASMAGLTAPGFAGPYNATKHAVVAVSETLYQELALLTEGAVGVSVLCPGWVRTNIHQSERNRPADLPAGEAGLAGDGLKAVIESGLDPAEVAQVVVEGVRDARFYLLTHPEMVPVVSLRAERLVAGENPVVGPPPVAADAEG